LFSGWVEISEKRTKKEKRKEKCGLFFQNGLKMKANYHNGLLKKEFTKMDEFCHIGSRRHHPG